MNYLRYLIAIAILGALIYHFSNMKLWTDEILAQGIAHNNDKYCSDPEILKRFDISTDKCISVYDASLPNCAAQAEQKFPGEEYQSQQQFVEAGDEIITCINNQLNK